MSRILTPQEIEAIRIKFQVPLHNSEITPFLDAQIASCDRENAEAIQQARRDTAKEILTEIQNEFFAEPQYIPASGHEKVLGCISVQDWAFLKAKYLPESKKEG